MQLRVADQRCSRHIVRRELAFPPLDWPRSVFPPQSACDLPFFVLHFFPLCSIFSPAFFQWLMTSRCLSVRYLFSFNKLISSPAPFFLLIFGPASHLLPLFHAKKNVKSKMCPVGNGKSRPAVTLQNIAQGRRVEPQTLDRLNIYWVALSAVLCSWPVSVCCSVLVPEKARYSHKDQQ